MLWDPSHTMAIYYKHKHKLERNYFQELVFSIFFLRTKKISIISFSRYLILVRIVKTDFNKSYLTTKKKERVTIHPFQRSVQRNNFVHKIIWYFINTNFMALSIQKVSNRKAKTTNFMRKATLLQLHFSSISILQSPLGPNFDPNGWCLQKST